MGTTWNKTAPGDWQGTLADGGTATAHARKVAAESDGDRLVVEVWATLPDGTETPHQRHSLGLDAVATGEIAVEGWLNSLCLRAADRAQRMIRARRVTVDLPKI